MRSSGALLPVPSWLHSPCPSYHQRDQWLPLQELADHLLLDPLQIKVLQGLPSPLHAVLAVGQDQRDQVSLHLVTDQVQVGHFQGADQVPAGSKGPLLRGRGLCGAGNAAEPKERRSSTPVILPGVPVDRVHEVVVQPDEVTGQRRGAQPQPLPPRQQHLQLAVHTQICVTVAFRQLNFS